MSDKYAERAAKMVKIDEEAQNEVKRLQILQTNPSGYIEADKETTNYTQNEIKRNVSLLTRDKAYNINLKGGPFFIDYSKNGRHLLINNKTGFLGAFDIKLLNLHFEINLDESIKEAIFLHNECLLATAQENNLFIYNNQGVELHCIRSINRPYRIEYLPYHFLLAALARGSLKYLDVTHGKLMADIPLKEEYTTIKHNKNDAIIYLGSKKGTISLFSPNSKEFLMKIFCNSSKVVDLQIERDGRHLVSMGIDKSINIFDIRNSFKPINSFRSKYHINCSDLSDLNMLATGHKKEVYIYKDLFTTPKLYLTHNMNSEAASTKFCPFEDILSVGCGSGVSNLIIPGSGDPVLDMSELNPFESKKERQNSEIKRLLEKIPVDLIGMNGFAFKEDTNIELPTEKAGSRYFDTKKSALDRFYNK